MHKIPYFS